MYRFSNSTLNRNRTKHSLVRSIEIEFYFHSRTGSIQYYLTQLLKDKQNDQPKLYFNPPCFLVAI